MIQYKYFHNSSGYVYRLSIGRESQDYTYMEKLFQTIRSMSEGNTFTYATLSSGSAVMMQSTSDSMAVFAHGMVCDGINDYPSKYINRLDTEIEDPENPPQQLPEAELPNVPRRAPEFPRDKIFHDFVPKIVDALLADRTGKQILIVTEGREESERFIGAISTVLPKQYMARIGFCIGVNSIATSEMKVVKANGETDDVSIRIWLPELMNYGFETFANAYHVFDAKAGRDNYSAALSSTSQVLQELNLSDSGEVGDFVSFIAPAFAADGAIDYDRLEALSAMYLLNLRKDYATAIKVLERSNIENKDDIPAINVAVSVMLDEKNSVELTTAYFEKALEICTKNEKIAASSYDKIVDYLKQNVSKHRELSEDGRTNIANLLRAKDSAGECLEKIFNNWWFMCGSPDDYVTVAKEAFILSMKMLEISFNNDFRAIQAKNIIPGVISFFNVDVFSKLRSSTQSLFDVAYGYKEQSVGNYSIALIMASAHISDDSQHYAIVIGHLKETLSKLSAKEQFNRILDIKKHVVDISDEFEELGLKNAQSFLLNTDVGRRWCEDIVGMYSDSRDRKTGALSDSLNELFGAYERVSSDDNLYPAMLQLIVEKLTDLDYIRQKKMKAGSTDFKKYKKIIDSIQDVASVQDILKYIEEVEAAGDKSKQHSNERFANATKQFNKFSQKERSEIRRESGISENVELESLEDNVVMSKFMESMNKRTGLANNTNTGKKKRKGAFLKSVHIDLGFLWTIIFPIISLVLIMVPALVISSVPETTAKFFEILRGYWAWLVAPVWCGLEALSLVVVRKNTGLVTKKDANTIAGGILLNIPLIIFDLFYVALYFIGINL